MFSLVILQNGILSSVSFRRHCFQCVVFSQSTQRTPRSVTLLIGALWPDVVRSLRVASGRFGSLRPPSGLCEASAGRGLGAAAFSPSGGVLRPLACATLRHGRPPRQAPPCSIWMVPGDQAGITASLHSATTTHTHMHTRAHARPHSNDRIQYPQSPHLTALHACAPAGFVSANLY